MKICFAVQTVDDPRVEGWFKKVGGRLREQKGVMIRGRVRSYGGGLYLVGVETAVGLSGFFMGPIMLILTGVVAWVLWHSVFWSNLMVGLGVVGMLMVSFLVNPVVYRFLMRLTLRRVVGRWVAVKPATQDFLWRLSLGKV